MPETNAITTRLDSLQRQWTRFAEDESARLLIWQVVEGEESMVDTFVEREASEELATTPDLFLQLQSPFSSERGHGYVLASELVAQYAKLVEAEVPPVAWVHPRTDTSRGDIEVLLEVLGSFRDHHLPTEAVAKLVVWLAPGEVSSARSYGAWIRRLVERAPSALRFLTLDDRAQPQLEALAAVAGKRVVTCACDLDMIGALEEVADALEGDTPDVQLAKLQVQLGKCLQEGELARSEQNAKAAVQFAEGQGWPHLAGMVHMMLASGYVAAQKPNEALASYGDAERCGTLSEAQEANDSSDADTAKTPPAGRLVRLHARLGQGAVLLMSRAYKHSTKVYEEAAELAVSMSQTSLALDAYRLASLSHSELGQPDAAWKLATTGFQLALTLDEQTRGSSTFPYLADQLVRLTERHESYAGHRRPLELRLAELLGQNWRGKLFGRAS